MSGTNDAASSKKKGPVICVFCGSSPGNAPEFVAAARELAKVFAENNVSIVYGGGTVGLMGEVARTMVKLAGPESVHGVIPRALVKYEARTGEAASASPRTRPSKDADNTSPSPVRGRLDGKESEKKNSVDIMSDKPASSLEAERDEELKKSIDPAMYGKTTIVRDMHTRKGLMAKMVAEGGPGSGFVALPGGFGTIEELMEMATWNQLGIHSLPVVAFSVNGFWDPLISWVDVAIKQGFIKEDNRDILLLAKTTTEVLGKLESFKVSGGQYQLNWNN